MMDSPTVGSPAASEPSGSDHALQPGDVLSYSAGSRQTSPLGFRKTQPDAHPFFAALQKWPDLASFFGPRPALLLHAYPGAIGPVPTAISVDTYLSPRVLSRALELGRCEDHPTLVAGSSLFLANALLKHIETGRLLPNTLFLGFFGHATPLGLETMLEDLLAPHVENLIMLQYFGVTEVDIGSMMSRNRTPQGEAIYHPREDIEPHLEDGQLLLSLRASTGGYIKSKFPTKDQARREGDGWVIENRRRYHPLIRQALESWRFSDWRRRTGYVRRTSDKLWIQLREGHAAQNPGELHFFEFAHRFGFSWLDKPYWR